MTDENQTRGGIDAELSAAVLAFYHRTDSPTPRQDPDAVRSVARARDPQVLLGQIMALQAEVFAIPMTWESMTLADVAQHATAVMAHAHPELSPQAAEALSWVFTSAAQSALASTPPPAPPSGTRAAPAGPPPSRGGLEQLMESRGIRLATWADDDPTVVRMWSDASGAYADGAAGEVRATIRTDLRPGNVWQSVQLPRLKANPRVTKIIVIETAAPARPDGAPAADGYARLGGLDHELSNAVLAYFHVADSSYPRPDPRAVLTLQTSRDSHALLAQVQALEDEVFAVPVDWSTVSLSAGGDHVQGVIAARHPELSPDAVHALRWQFTYTNR